MESYISQGLQRAFLSFVDAAQTRLHDVQRQGLGDILSKSVVNLFLPRLVEELESEQEFRHLVMETRSAFFGDRHQKSSENAWHRAVHNYFCRSGCYLNLAVGHLESPDEAFSAYCTAFTRQQVQVTYLAPLEFVHFVESLMDFGTYQIKRFSVQELETILQHRINSVFYPWAAISSDSLKLLSQYWFIQITEAAAPSHIGDFTLPASSSTTLLFSGYADREYTGFPRPVEAALRQLCLFDWAATDRTIRKRSPVGIMSSKENEYDLYLKFNVPFVLQMNYDLIEYPEHVPIIQLNTQPSTDPQTGEEAGEEPQVYIYLDQNETQRFIVFMKHIQDMILSVERDKDSWDFIEIALGYFTKAFFTQPGLEQLLWHVIVLEALLGEEGKGITERLAKRIGLILGKGENERQEISSRFRELYKVRNSLVHGKSQSKADVMALIDAYRFSRLAIIWFLNYLSSIQSEVAKCQGDSSIPNRKELLMLLDSHVHTFTGKLHQLKDKLPSKFPHVPDWID